MIPTLDEIEVDRIHRGNDGEKKAARRSVAVDMNPMVDLAFLLLTFFMLATTFSKPQAMELLVPAKPTQEELEKEMPVKESKTLSLILNKEELIWYKGITEPETHRITYGNKELESLLEREKNQTDGLVVLIKPLETSQYSNLVDVLDLLNYVGVKRYAISELSEFDLEEGKKSNETDE